MSGLRRFFVEKVDDVTEICGDEYSHAINTLRIGKGDSIILCDNSGIDYVCEVSEVRKKSFIATVIEKVENDTETKTAVKLICGYLKGDKTEYVVQKAVELGVNEIVVFSSAYSSAYMSDNKLARLNKVSVEAAKQCGRSIAPKVVYCDKFVEAIRIGENCKNRLFAYENIDNYTTHISSIIGDTAIVIGSEGGFSKEEVEVALSMDYKVVTLGKRILRADTAAVCALSLVMYELGELR
jgi:16S rRNA (uracil1498-N3)-methyltransferase